MSFLTFFFIFREYYKKDYIEFLTDLNPEEVFFQQQITLIFEPEKSVGPLTDMITTLNLVGAVSIIFRRGLRENVLTCNFQGR